MRVWAPHCNESSEFIQAVKARKVFGHLEHPKDGKSDLKEAAIVITNVALQEDGQVIGTLETLSTLAGQTAKALLKDGLSVGISSRAHGSVQRLPDGIDEVQEDFTPETFDLVAEPSTPGAFLHESLQEQLRTKGEADIRAEEQIAKLSVQAHALLEECLNAKSWDVRWVSRNNDLLYVSKNLKESTEDVRTTLRLLSEAISMKQNLYSRTSSKWSRLIEQAENAAQEAQAASVQAQDAAKRAAEEVAQTQTPATATSTDTSVEIAAAMAKCAAGKAEAAAQVAKEASSEEVAQVAATMAQEAADDAKKAAETAVAASSGEITANSVTEVPAATPVVPEAPAVVTATESFARRENRLNENEYQAQVTRTRQKYARDIQRLKLDHKYDMKQGMSELAAAKKRFEKELSALIARRQGEIDQIRGEFQRGQKNESMTRTWRFLVEDAENAAQEAQVAAQAAQAAAEVATAEVVSGASNTTIMPVTDIDKKNAEVAAAIAKCAAGEAEAAAQAAKEATDEEAAKVAANIAQDAAEKAQLAASDAEKAILPTEIPTEVPVATTPVVDVVPAIEPVDVPPVPVSVESYSARVGQSKVVQDLREDNLRLQRELKQLQTENKNLRVLNQETVALFEREILKFEAQRLIRQNPKLDKFRGILYKCKSVPNLHETTNAFVSALKESAPPVRRKGGRVPAANSGMVLPKFDASQLPPLQLQESKQGEMSSNAVAVADSQPREDNIFSKLANRRNKQ